MLVMFVPQICGQLCGAFYGIDDLEPEWVRAVHRWDARQIEMRAVLLVSAPAQLEL